MNLSNLVLWTDALLKRIIGGEQGNDLIINYTSISVTHSSVPC